MGDYQAPLYPTLASLVDPYLAWRERQVNSHGLADLLLPKALPEYLHGLAYDTLPKEAPLTSWRSTMTYGPAALDVLAYSPLVKQGVSALASIGQKAGSEMWDAAARAAAQGRRMVPAGQLNMGVGPSSDAAIAALNQADPATRAMIANDLKAKGLRDVQITDGVIRDEIARRNATTMLGLPEGNTAADRAAAMGFDYENPVYHGHRGKIDAFDAKKALDKKGDTSLHYFSNDEWYAQDFGPNVDEYVLRKKNPFDISHLDVNEQMQPKEWAQTLNDAGLDKVRIPQNLAKTGLHVPSEERQPGTITLWELLRANNAGKHNIYASLKRGGYDSMLTNEGGGTQIVFNPNQIRTPNAAFDPARAKEADILAGLGSAAVTTPAAVSLADYFRMRDRGL